MRQDETPRTEAPIRRVVMVVPDLFFSTRIREVARGAGAAVESAAPDELAERCRDFHPELVLLDLQAPGVLEAIASVRTDPELGYLVLVGFHAHVDLEARDRAMKAGLSRAMARSAFTRLLPELLAARPAGR